MIKTMISARIPEKLSQELEALAERSQRSKGFLLTVALEDFVERESRLRDKIDAAVKAADESSEWHSHESVSKWIMSWGTENELPPPKPDIFTEKKTP